MNKGRRKDLSKAVTLLNEAQAALENAKEIVESVKDDEDMAYENLPDSLKDSDKGVAMQDNVESLDGIAYELDSIYDNVEEQIEEINNVIDA